MKVFSTISKTQKAKLNQEIANFNKPFVKTPIGNYGSTMHKYGLLIHGGACVLLISALIKNMLSDKDLIQAASEWGVLKINFDFVPYLNNIIKKKAALLSTYLKNRDYSREERAFAVKQFFIRNGKPLYPLLHPINTKKIIDNGEYFPSSEPLYSVAHIGGKSKNLSDIFL